MGAAAAAGIGAVGAIGASALSSGKGSGGSSSGATSQSPWAPQQPYMMSGFQDATNAYNTNAAQGPYQGAYVAGQSPMQGTAIGSTDAYNTQLQNLPGQTGGTASGLQTAAYPNMQTAGNMAANGAGPSSPLAGILNGYATGQNSAIPGLNPQLNNSLTQAGINGAQSLGGFTNAQNQVVNESLSDPTTGLIGDASAYMNAAPVQSAIQNTNAQINQQLNEQTVPQLNREASMGGSLNSSRAGMAEGMANQSAAIATGNADSQIENNAYNTGLSTAAAERNAGLTTAMYGANSGLVDNSNIAQGQNAALTGQGEFGTNTALGATNSGLNYALGEQGLNANTMLSANAQLGNATSMGLSGTGAADNAALQQQALLANGGNLQAQAQQENLTNSYDQYQMDQNQPYQNLDNYWNIVGKPEGSQGTTAQQQQIPPNYIGNALGGGTAGYALSQNGGLSGLFGGGENAAFNAGGGYTTG